jgi:hypothetical protein
MRHNDQSPEGWRDRTLGNIIILVILVGLLGGGIWIANVMLDVRKIQDCVASGRRNCAPVDVPLREQ